MSISAYTKWSLAATILGISMNAAIGQDIPPVNSGGNPYRVIRDWAQLTQEKRPWGGSNGVAMVPVNEAGSQGQPNHAIATLNFQIIPGTRWEAFTLEFLAHQECRGKERITEALGADAAKGLGCSLSK